VLGRVDEKTKWDLMARAHLLLVPSVREGWGMVVTEAGAVATPAIGYRVPGLVDSIRDGVTGWLCDPTPEAMAAAAVRALGDQALAAVGAQARRWAGERSWDQTADHVLGRVGERVAAR
jgi:glycosyltransferase involved in cell wall biosynthesis